MTYNWGRKADCAHHWSVLHLRKVLFRSTEGGIHVQVKNKLVILMEPSYFGKGPDETLEAGGLFKLNAGYAISLTLHHGPAILVMQSAHTYFGAVQ